ncbi:hypothetical protein LY12_003500 [Prauserella alba]|uniref:Uncharacterized protein n=1 Tax=Prauserella alba TaxID=176898 RepID=A0ABP4G9X1_9PSEU|nr:hypothetical protein [Prauserella alba]
MIGSYWLIVGVDAQIQAVIHDLEGDSHVAAELVEAPNILCRDLCLLCAEYATQSEQLSGFTARELDVVSRRNRGVKSSLHVEKFATRQFSDRVAHCATYHASQIGGFCSDLGETGSTSQNCQLWAGHLVGGRGAASRCCSIYDVIM